MSIPLVGVLNGLDLSLSDLSELLAQADRVIAADGAARRCLAAGRPPDLVVGDLDSLPELERAGLNVHRVWDQDRTDAEKLLDQACEEGYDAITVVGIEGDLPDHSLAAWGALARSPLRVRVRLRRGWAYVVKAVETLVADAGDRISFIPLVPCRGVKLTGVFWPLAEADLRLDAVVSVSNRATGGPVEVTLRQGVGVLFHLRDELTESSDPHARQ